MSLTETMEQHRPMNDESFEQFRSVEDYAPIHILGRIKIWPAPVRDLNLTDINVDGVVWEWIWQFGCWAITDGNTTYEKDGWSDYCDDHKNKPGLHSESSTVVWPEGTPDGHIAVHDNINGDIYVVAPNHEFKTNEDVVCVKQTASEPTQPQSAPHIFDLIGHWPDEMNKTEFIIGPDGWRWKYVNNEFVLTNGYVNLTHDDWFKYKFVESELSPTVELGTKADSGKPMMGCIPPHAELAVARVLTFGAQKYSRGNWVHVETSDERYMDAALRHINAHRRGENADSETGESHLAHAICCLMFMLESK